MPLEIPRLRSAKRRSFGPPVMSQLESRTMMSATPRVIHVGPGQKIKTFSAISFPKKGDNTPVKVILDYSSSPYSVKHKSLWGNVTIESANTSKQATLKLSENDYPMLYVNGTLNIHNIKTVGGSGVILLGSAKGSNINAERVTMTDGGAMWLGSGGNNIVFKNNDVLGKPHNYVYANFNNKLNNLIIDNSGTKVPVQQGGHMSGGNPVGEAAIRLMNVDKAQLIGITTKPWFYKPGKEWKQDVQLRPTSTSIKVINCNFYQPDVGDMLWRKPAWPMKSVEFIGCTFAKSPSITNGVSFVSLTKCRIGSYTTTKSLR